MERRQGAYKANSCLVPPCPIIVKTLNTFWWPIYGQLHYLVGVAWSLRVTGVLKQTAQWKLVANKILIFKQRKESNPNNCGQLTRRISVRLRWWCNQTECKKAVEYLTPSLCHVLHPQIASKVSQKAKEKWRKKRVRKTCFPHAFHTPPNCIERRKRQIRRLSTFLATLFSQAFVKPTRGERGGGQQGRGLTGSGSAVKSQKGSLHNTLIHAMTPQSTVQQRCQSASHPVRQSEGLPHYPPLPCPSPPSVSQSNKQLAKKACRWASQIAQAMLQHKRWLRFTLAQAITHHLPRKCVCVWVRVCVRLCDTKVGYWQ